MSNKIKYDKKKNLAQSYMLQIVNHEQIKMQNCNYYFFISQKKK